MDILLLVYRARSRHGSPHVFPLATSNNKYVLVLVLPSPARAIWAYARQLCCRHARSCISSQHTTLP